MGLTMGKDSHMNGARRVVVTGMGVVTPIGNDVPTFWSALKEGKSGIGPLQDIDFPEQYVRDLYIQIACQVKNFDPKTRLKNRLLLLADRYSLLAAYAAHEAFEQSKLEAPLKNPYRSACIIGSGAGGMNTIEWAYNQLFTKNRRAGDPLLLLKFIGSSAAAHVGIDYGIKGPTFGTVSACATATHAIGLMQRFIRDGVADVGVAGASESAINYGSMKAWQSMRVLSPDGCYPFAKKRNGTVLGEGARVFTENASGVVVSDTKRVIALIGIKDVVIVDTPDALLVTTKEHSQRVKQAVDAIKAKGDTDVL